MGKRDRSKGRGDESRLKQQIESLKRRLSQTKEEDERRQITREIDRLKSDLQDSYDYD